MRLNLKVIGIVTLTLLAACGDSNDKSAAPAVVIPPPEDIAISGVVMDGPVSGGRVYVFGANDVQPILDAAEDADDRGASLGGADPIDTATPGEDGSYSLTVPGTLADGTVMSIVFDNADAEDMTFGDTPFNMESVVVTGAAGGQLRANVTPQSSVVARQVRSALPLSGSAATDEIDAANVNVVSALGTDQLGMVLLEEGTDVISLDDTEVLEAAATFMGSLVRSTAAATGLAREDVLEALSFDAMDGDIDGSTPASVDADVSDRIAAVDGIHSLGEVDDPTITVGSCASTATLLKRSCDIDVMDDYLEALAGCQDDDVDALEECIADAQEERGETVEECGVIYEARIDLCDDLDDAVHDPAFGEAFADNFVDPRDIGDSVEPNPYLPLVYGNKWVYESNTIDEDSGEEVTETVTVTVTDKTKLIQGIDCVVVRDIVEEDGELVEDTDDWFAQDVDGNVWYCGEIAQNFEFFDGDEPEEAELVDIGGSWKAGREGAKAGILMPIDPQVGDVIRNEILYGEAEDVIEIMGLNGDESTEGADCDGSCLWIKEFTPLEADSEESTFIKAGVGVILKMDVESGDREELISFSNEAEPGTLELAAGKLLIEHNATDEDTGFQGFADGSPWDRLSITGPDNEAILVAESGGGLFNFGLTEFFFETSEPENAEVPIDDVTDRLVEGTYTFSGNLAEGGVADRETMFSHDIPAGPTLLTPEEDAEDVDPANTVISWQLVIGDLDDEEIEIVGYQVIVEEEADPYDVDGFAKPVMSVYLPATATSLTVPEEFMNDDACYEYEVLAIEESGNQTLASTSFETGDGCDDVEEAEDPEGLKVARILIEHNATDGDTGFQGFADGDPWNELSISDPDDEDIVTVIAAGGLLDFGLTELFFETSEPPNVEVSIDDVIDRLPEGTYVFSAEVVDGDESEMLATFTHDIPAGPVLVSPENEEEDVDPAATIVSWELVTTDIDGDPITIVGYQVIVEEDLDEEPFPAGFAEPVFSVYLPPTATSVTIPAEFMRPDTDYEWEVLAIEESGNQTLSSAEFVTAE
jgi:hypothetical protein